MLSNTLPTKIEIVHQTLQETYLRALKAEDSKIAMEKAGELVLANGVPGEVPFFIQMNREIAKNGEGFVGYDWPKPTAAGLTESQPKLSYVKLFKPWGWVLGTGVYISGEESSVQKETLSVVEEFRFGKTNDDYF